MKKDDIINFLKDNPDLVLEYCRHPGSEGWWWIRDTKSNKYESCDGRSASAASKKLHIYNQTWREISYRYKP